MVSTMVIGPGRVSFSFRVRVGAGKPRFARVHPLRAAAAGR